MALNFLTSVGIYLDRNGFSVENYKSYNPGGTLVDLYGFRKGYSFWKLFPFEDHFFFYNFDIPERNNTETLNSLHNDARAWVNSQFTKPKWMRYKVPSIITIGFSEQDFSTEMKELVLKPMPYGVGGEKHAIFLIEINSKNIYSPGIQRTSATAVSGGALGSVSIAPKEIDPVNRAYYLITGLMKNVL